MRGISNSNDAGAGAPYGGEFGNAGYGNNGSGNDSGSTSGGDARMGDASGSDTTGSNAYSNYGSTYGNAGSGNNSSGSPTPMSYQSGGGGSGSQGTSQSGGNNSSGSPTPSSYQSGGGTYSSPSSYSGYSSFGGYGGISSSSNTSYSPKNSAGWSGSHPILLDLSGHGINIAELTRSTKFLDATGSGLSHRTAWAGVGTGVLFYDPGSTGQITSKNQYVFTEWDKTAKGDLEALLNVFDSNGDGKLDASDAKFSLFKVMVTNADGTTTAHTLTELGITAINLKADLTNITYADGSRITGETTFTKADGTTGTVANTSLAYDGNGRAVTTTSATDASGTVSVTSTGLNSDGSIAFVDTSTTTADGSAITNTYDHNGDGRAAAGNARQKGPVDLFELRAHRAILRGAGLIDHIQLITTSTDAGGTRSETITNSNGGHVLLDSIQTITSSDGASVTINRDTTGGGWVNQSEQRTTSADGNRTVVVTQLSADGNEVVGKATNDNTAPWECAA